MYQDFVDVGRIDGQSATHDTLYDALHPFVDPDEEMGRQAFIASLKQLTSASQLPSARLRETEDAQESSDSDDLSDVDDEDEEAADTRAAQQSPKFVRMRGTSSLGARPCATGSTPVSNRPIFVLRRKHASLEDLSTDVLQCATQSPADPTIVDYISNLFRHGLGEEDASDLLDTVCGKYIDLREQINRYIHIFPCIHICVCILVCIHVYIFTHTHKHMYIYIRTYAYIYMYAYIIYIYLFMHTYINICVNEYVHLYICMYIYI